MGTCPDRSCIKQLRVHHAHHQSSLGFPGSTNVGLLPTRGLAIEVTLNYGPSNSLAEAFLKEENLRLEDLERIVRGKVAAIHTHPATSTQTNPALVTRKSPIP